MALVIFLFVVAAVLILAEFFIPGGILGVIGVLALIGSMALAWTTFPEYGLFIVLAEIIGITICIFGGVRLLLSGKVHNPMILQKQQDPNEGYSSPEVDAALLGSRGIAFTALRPAGTILVNGDRIDAVSDATFIEKDAAIEIVEIEGHRVVVEKIVEDDGAPA